jgi:hypothetical protein
MWRWLGLGMVMLVAAMPLGCSTDEEDMHTQILRSAQSKGGTVNTPATPKVQLPSGETVWDLSGDWDTLNENYGPMERFGTYRNVYRITQTGSTLSAIRLQDTPQPSSGKAGTQSLLGELDKGGFKRVEIVTTAGTRAPIKGQISADGKKIVLDDGWSAKITLTRP